jgi:hypothetical protein
VQSGRKTDLHGRERSCGTRTRVKALADTAVYKFEGRSRVKITAYTLFLRPNHRCQHLGFHCHSLCIMPYVGVVEERVPMPGVWRGV